MGPKYYFFYRIDKKTNQEELMFYINFQIINNNDSKKDFYFQPSYFEINKIDHK